MSSLILFYGISLTIVVLCIMVLALFLQKKCCTSKIALRDRFDHVTELLIDHHWLPISYKISYKVYLLAHKCINPALFAHPEELKSLVSTGHSYHWPLEF